ncbi:molybdenum cofactor guanylyltransferase [Deinococcus sp.]|uniref:molybdenum cofactor guanylyltransferase n=1 Tax=Deinococcus sp. TaxID=47478 RepID=UPI0025B8F923|nr:molybdenum cofactor guanylyltransferase [Deinococcus sp.]
MSTYLVPHSAAFTAAITAGGQSRRFGSDKAAALLSGQTLLQRVAESLGAANQKILIAPLGRYGLPGWATLPDTRSGEGPLAGLELALHLAHHEWVAFAGVDQPLLTPAYWQVLYAARCPDCLSVQALDPRGQRHPLAALYHISLLPGITAQLDAGERRLRLACPAQKIREVTGLPEMFFRNINHVEDLERLEQSCEQLRRLL